MQCTLTSLHIANVTANCSMCVGHVPTCTHCELIDTAALVTLSNIM